MLNFNLFFPFLPGPKRTFVLYVLEEQSQFDVSMCVLRALFTVCTLPDLICRGLSSITFIYKKKDYLCKYMPQCCNTYRHIVHIVKFHTIDHFKIFKVTSKYYRHFSSPLWLGWFLLIRTYSLKLNFCSHCIQSYHKSISNISNKLFPAKVHHNLFNLEWKEKGSCSHLYRKNM